MTTDSNVARLARIEVKLDRMLEHVLGVLPRPRSTWPDRMSVRAKNVVQRQGLSVDDVRARGRAALTGLRNCGQATIAELLSAASEREAPTP